MEYEKFYVTYNRYKRTCWACYKQHLTFRRTLGFWVVDISVMVFVAVFMWCIFGSLSCRCGFYLWLFLAVAVSVCRGFCLPWSFPCHFYASLLLSVVVFGSCYSCFSRLFWSLFLSAPVFIRRCFGVSGCWGPCFVNRDFDVVVNRFLYSLSRVWVAGFWLLLFICVSRFWSIGYSASRFLYVAIFVCRCFWRLLFLPVAAFLGYCLLLFLAVSAFGTSYLRVSLCSSVAFLVSRGFGSMFSEPRFWDRCIVCRCTYRHCFCLLLFVCPRFSPVAGFVCLGLSLPIFLLSWICMSLFLCIVGRCFWLSRLWSVAFSVRRGYFLWLILPIAVFSSCYFCASLLLSAAVFVRPTVSVHQGELFRERQFWCLGY